MELLEESRNPLDSMELTHFIAVFRASLLFAVDTKFLAQVSFGSGCCV